jgi:hypothetical protein
VPFCRIARRSTGSRAVLPDRAPFYRITCRSAGSRAVLPDRAPFYLTQRHSDRRTRCSTDRVSVGSAHVPFCRPLRDEPLAQGADATDPPLFIE